MNIKEQKAMDELKQALVERKDDALIKGYLALEKGDYDEYARQWQDIEETHSLLKAMAKYVWASWQNQPEARLQ